MRGLGAIGTCWKDAGKIAVRLARGPILFDWSDGEVTIRVSMFPWHMPVAAYVDIESPDAGSAYFIGKPKSGEILIGIEEKGFDRVNFHRRVPISVEWVAKHFRLKSPADAGFAGFLNMLREIFSEDGQL